MAIDSLKITPYSESELSIQLEEILTETELEYRPADFNMAEKQYAFACYHHDIFCGGIIAQQSYAHLNIDMLAVKPSQQGKGIGSLLLQHVEQLARQENLHHILVFTLSFQAPSFYKKMGFEEFARVKNFPTINSEAIYFIKYL